MSSYTIWIRYMDERYLIPIQNANVTYVMKNPTTGETIDRGSMSYSSGYYTKSLDLTTVSEGTYLIEICTGKKNFENQTVAITFVIRLHETIAQPDTTKITVYYDENITMKINYYDQDFDEYIAGASASCTISGVEEGMPTVTTGLNDLGNGTYLLNIPASTMGMLGSYSITITLSKQHYEQWIIYASLVIKAIPTIASASKTSETLEYELSTTITIWYNDSRTGTPIQDLDNKTYVIWRNTTLIGAYQLTSNQDGSWALTLDTISMGLVPGTYTVYVYLEKAYHENKTLVITLTVNSVATYAYAEPANVTLYWDETGETKVYWNRTRDWAFISVSPDFSVKDLDTGEYVTSINAVTVSTETGYYAVTINASKLVNGHTYVIEITFTKQHYESGVVVIYINILTIPTIASISKSTEEIEWSMSTEITVIYADFRSGVPIDAENASFIIQNDTWNSLFNLTRVDEGTYRLTIDTLSMHLAPDYYTITVILEKPHHENRTLIITLTVNMISTYSYAQPANLTLYWGDKASSTIYYNRSLTEEPIANADITLIVMDITGAELSVPEDAFTIVEENGAYVLNIDSTKLADEFVYLLNITLSKTYHDSGVILIFVRVRAIPVNVMVTPLVADMVWGDDFNYSMLVINSVNGSGVPDIVIGMTVYVGGEKVDVGDAIQIIQLDVGTYVILVKSGLLNTTSYSIFVSISKPHHSFPAVNVTARVHPVSASVSIRTGKTVYKNPATGAAVTEVEVVLREAETNAPLSGATVKVAVMRGETIASEISAAESTDNPGVYIATIDWSQLEPGDYTIRVYVEKIQRRGYQASAAYTLDIVRGETEVGVSVDYFGGSTVIAGKRYPNLLVYPPLIGVLLIVGFVGYRYYAWFRLPIEVREVIKLLKKIQKDIYEYEAPTREDMFRELIATHLGLE